MTAKRDLSNGKGSVGVNEIYEAQRCAVLEMKQQGISKTIKNMKFPGRF